MAITVFAQNKFRQVDVHVNRSSSSITIDGKLEEDAWSSSDTASGFYQIFPQDSIPAIDSTNFSIIYDKDFIYIGIICYDSNNDKEIISQSLRRDFSWGGNDNVSIYLDPFNDQANGFTFQVTPLNVQREGLVTFGGSVADDWDNKWYSATQIYDDRWVAEMAIPFKSIRYNSTKSWGIQVLRNNLKINERSAWIQVPIQYRPSDLVYSGNMIWDTPPPEQGSNISLIPYITGNIDRDYDTESEFNRSANAGFDAKIGVTNSLNLDLTVNPDFSQVEVDRQVTNLNRFEIFFPERRQFFLENQDLFAQNGFPDSRPFFSRRIGIGQDDDGLARQIPILGGARLSGKIGADWRVGMLTMQTAEDKKSRQPSQNYSVGVFQKRILGRSTVGGIFVNRQAYNYSAEDTTFNTTAYNRVFGGDFNYLSIDNRWEGNFYHHISLDPDRQESSLANGGFLSYRVREFSVYYFHNLIGEGYNAEVGFVPRTGVFSVGAGSEYNFYPDSKIIQRHGPEVEYSTVTDQSLNKLDEEINANYRFSFLNTSFFAIGTSYSSILLTDDFDPTDSDGAVLPEGERYNWMNYGFFYNSDERKKFNYFLDFSFGGFYSGSILSTGAGINYRFQPFLVLSMDAFFNKVELEEPLKDADFFLIGPRIDLTLTSNLFFTTFMQYNNQIDNFNINSRLQWRFKPVSDLFIVYTDNYNTLNWDTKNRALIVKLSYWFNL